MAESNSTVLPWLVVRHDGEENHYRVGRYATRTEAEQVADRLDHGGEQYIVERSAAPGPQG